MGRGWITAVQRLVLRIPQTTSVRPSSAAAGRQAGGTPAPNKSSRSRSRSKVAKAAAQPGQAGQETAGDVGVGPGFEQECVDLGEGSLPGSGCWCSARLRAPGAARLDRGLEERDDELAADRAANRELITQLNTGF